MRQREVVVVIPVHDGHKGRDIFDRRSTDGRLEAPSITLDKRFQVAPSH